jgi:adenylate cyclase
LTPLAEALDPTYAAAYVSLGYTLRFQWNWLWNEDPDPLNHALQLAKQAIALDETLASAHGLLSALYMSQAQFDQALGEAQRAVALDPNSADSYNALWRATAEKYRSELSALFGPCNTRRSVRG